MVKDPEHPVYKNIYYRLYYWGGGVLDIKDSVFGVGSSTFAQGGVRNNLLVCSLSWFLTIFEPVTSFILGQMMSNLAI